MTKLEGLPDFQAPIAAGTTCAFAPFGAGSYRVLPGALSIARDADGRPTFTLVMLKRADDPRAAGQYGVMDATLIVDFPLDDALATARTNAASATMQPAVINAGYAR